jgi:uncharacterized membrane protein YbhN (UPF0104 family)
MKSGKSNARRWIVTAGKIALVCLVLWGLGRTLNNALSQLQQENWTISDVRPAWLVAAGLLYTVGQLASALFWHRLLQIFNQPAPLFPTIRAWYIGGLGKYVPGKAMVIILRTALMRKYGVGIAVSTATIFYETLTAMAVGATLAGAILAIVLRDQPKLALSAAVLILAAGAPVIPPIFKRLARLAGIERAAPGMIDRLDHLRPIVLVRSWLSLAAGWTMIGLSVWACVHAVGDEAIHYDATLVAISIAAAGLSVVAGFASFIPGGLGVRDFVVVELLIPVLGEGPALVAALLVRLVWLLSELGISIILYPLERRGGSVASQA